jgi:hypothetical protein
MYLRVILEVSVHQPVDDVCQGCLCVRGSSGYHMQLPHITSLFPHHNVRADFYQRAVAAKNNNQVYSATDQASAHCLISSAVLVQELYTDPQNEHAAIATLGLLARLPNSASPVRLRTDRSHQGDRSRIVTPPPA